MEQRFKLPPGVSAKDYLPGVIIVKIKETSVGQPSIRQDAGIPTISLSSVKVLSIKNKFPNPENGERPSTFRNRDDIGLNRVYELRFVGATAIEDVINEVLKDEHVEYAEPQYIHHSNYAPNDPSYGTQTYLDQVKAPDAWDIIRNASGVVIGIVDSGSDLDHPDIAPNIFINAADPINGLDDDMDGYTDNYQGWDLVGTSGILPIADNDPNVKSAASDHGAHVSGIASAVSDNGIGVASIAYNAKLLIVKAGADNDATTIYAGYEGIKYAADHGAQIINCSWGGPGGGAYGRDVINYALSKGCLVVAAAGNGGNTLPDYPAAYPGVLAVANVKPDDVKHISSNYGSYVAISAPGTNIYSTGFNDSYKYDTGTSMAAPVVSSAAALVKARFPLLSMQEVGERLRVTADDIDAINPAFAGRLGKGRLNVFRALTEDPPSVRNQKLTVIDKGNGSRPAGETFELYFDLKNFLAPANGLKVTLSTNNPYISIMTASIDLGNLGTGETKPNIGPFLVLVSKDAPDNTKVDFRLNYMANSGAYVDFETFTLLVALDYINYNINQVATTITSNGRIGYSDAQATRGQGFVYKNQSLLYETSLLMGNSSTRVSNNVRSGAGTSDEHFVKKVRVKSLQNTPSFFEALAELDDSGSAQPLNIDVQYRQLAFSQAPDDKYTIAEYKIINKGSTVLQGVYAGLFTDWDIDNGSNNVTEYDEINRMGYTYAKTSGSLYTGVKLLTKSASPAYYPLSYSVPGNLLENDPFTISEKFQALSSGIKAKELGKGTAAGYDVMYVIGSGPYDIAVNDSVQIAFALIAGDNLSDIQNSAAAAQAKFDETLLVEVPAIAAVQLKSYPNPTRDVTTIQFSVPDKGNVSLSLFSISGARVKSLIKNREYDQGVYHIPVNLLDLEEGVYICKFRFNNIEKSTKISLIR